MTTSPGHLTIDGLTISYPNRNGRERTTALQDINLQLDNGSFTALLGASGCGKSTLLNAIAGFLASDRGEIRLDGSPVTAPGPERSVVFQQYALLPWMSAQGNIELVLRNRGFSKKDRQNRSQELLAAVGLAHAASQLPQELSGGMQQRVSIARALAAEPSVLLMDEPFGALDAITRATMQDLVLDLWRKENLTVVFVTHDVDEALYLGERIVTLSSPHGRVSADIDLRNADEFNRSNVRAQIITELGGH